MLWHRQAIFESKGDKLSSSAEGRIRTHQGLRHQIASRLNARWQTDWAIEDQAKNLNSTARPYDQRAFSNSSFLDPGTQEHLLSPTGSWTVTCLTCVLCPIPSSTVLPSLSSHLYGPQGYFQVETDVVLPSLLPQCPRRLHLLPHQFPAMHCA